MSARQPVARDVLHQNQNASDPVVSGALPSRRLGLSSLTLRESPAL